MKKARPLFFPNKLGVSYAISTVVISAAIIVLVIVASSYAYQLLDQQRGAAEFEVAKESILTFDDALENIAWKPGAAQSARFTISYGQLELIPASHPQASPLVINIDKNNVSLIPEPYSVSTGFLRYSVSNRYTKLWEGYSSYILGDENLIVANGTERFGRALVEKASGYANITLDYRVRAMKTSTITVDGVRVSYVDIWVIKLDLPEWSTYIHDFNLKARCLNVSTESYGPYSVDATDDVRVQVQYGSDSSWTGIEGIETGDVIINFILSEVKVTF